MSDNAVERAAIRAANKLLATSRARDNAFEKIIDMAAAIALQELALELRNGNHHG